jgi:hypothetical protein
VLRLRQSLGDGDRRTIGLIGLNKDSPGPEHYRAGGFDWQYALTDHLSSAGYVAKTETPGLRGRDYAGSADLLYQSPVIQARTSYTDIGDNFNPEMGFSTRVGERKLQSELLGYFNLDWGLLHYFTVINDFNHVVDQQGRLESQVWLRELTFITVHREGIALLSYDTRRVLTLPLVLHKGVVIPPGEYRYVNRFIGLASDYSKPLGITVRYDTGDFYDGHRLEQVVGIVYRPVRGMDVELTWDSNQVRTPHGRFISDLYYADISYSPTTSVLLRSLVQWNREDNFRANFLIGWTYRPGSSVYLVYNDVRDIDPSRLETTASSVVPGRSYILKISRRFDF